MDYESTALTVELQAHCALLYMYLLYYASTVASIERLWKPLKFVVQKQRKMPEILAKTYQKYTEIGPKPWQNGRLLWCRLTDWPRHQTGYAEMVYQPIPPIATYCHLSYA